jgi:hypothetical protein
MFRWVAALGQQKPHYIGNRSQKGYTAKKHGRHGQNCLNLKLEGDWNSEQQKICRWPKHSDSQLIREHCGKMYLVTPDILAR